MIHNYQTIILDSGNFVWTLLPVSSVVFIFWFLSKKKNRKKEDEKHQKDELWYIVKGHLKKEGKIGYEITDLTLYPRPTLKDLNGYIYRSEIAKAKQKAEIEKRKYIKPTRQKKYEIEKIFEEIEKKSQEKYVSKNKNKIYVVCYRLKERSGEEINDWECIEVELYKENISNLNYSIKTKNLDYKFESTWIFEMQFQYLNEKYAEAKRKLENAQKQEKRNAIKIDFLKVFKNIYSEIETKVTTKLKQISEKRNKKLLEIVEHESTETPQIEEDTVFVEETSVNVEEDVELPDEPEVVDLVENVTETTLKNQDDKHEENLTE